MESSPSKPPVLREFLTPVESSEASGNTASSSSDTSMEGDSTPPYAHKFMPSTEFSFFYSSAPRDKASCSGNADPDSELRLSGTKRSHSDFASSSAIPSPISNRNPNPNPNPDPHQNPNTNTSLNPNHNPNLHPSHNPNLNPDHNPNLNRTNNPNPNLNLTPYSNPSSNTNNDPNPDQSVQRDIMEFLSLGSNTPQISNQPKTNPMTMPRLPLAPPRTARPPIMPNPRMISRLPPPPPRRVPPIVEKYTKNMEDIRSLLLSCENVSVPDDDAFPGATKTVLNRVKKLQAGSTSNSGQGISIGNQMTILYGTQCHVFENIHPNKVRQILSFAASPSQPTATSEASRSTNTQANSTKLLANSAPIPGTELRLNFIPTEVIDVDKPCNSKEALPGTSNLKEPDVQPLQTEKVIDQDVDQTNGNHADKPQE